VFLMLSIIFAINAFLSFVEGRHELGIVFLSLTALSIRLDAIQWYMSRKKDKQN